MIQTQKQSLSESEKETIRDWLSAPGADLFLKVIRAEQAYMQAETGGYFAARRNPDTAQAINETKAAFFGDRAWELEFLIRKFSEMKEDKYEYYTATLTP